jgi:CO/xanthine dehydrogenase Mo-binding subunit
MDLPEIEGTFIQTHLNQGPFGAKNMGEPLMLATAPAIANAVFHATGVRVHRLPIDPSALKDANA